MITKLYSVFDAAVQAFMPPFYARTNGEAIRSFTDAANDERRFAGRNNADYTLFYLGEFDDGSGLVKPVDVPQRLISAPECKVDDVGSFKPMNLKLKDLEK